MTKNELVKVLKDSLLNAKQERQKVKENPTLSKAKKVLKDYQIQRLKSTHANLLSSPDTKEAAQFFLNEIYGSKDLSQRDADLEKLIPTMEKVFPAAALEVITNAIVLDALTETLDNKMASQLGESFTDEEYIKVYKEQTSKEDRLKQIKLTESVGSSLCTLVNLPLIATTLKMMAFPAKLANLSEMHNFLNEGFYTFKKTKNPREFIHQLVEKEKKLLEETY